MAAVATLALDSERLRTNGSSPLGEPVEFDIKGLGRRLPRTDAPEGWIKKVERRRQGKVWVGFFHLWVTDPTGRRIRQKKEKMLGPASMPKHEAQQKLAEYIEEYTGRITKQDKATQLTCSLICGTLTVPSDRANGQRRRRKIFGTFLRNT